MKKCSVEGCGRFFYAKGFCQKHYKQNLKHGQTFLVTKNDSNEIITTGSIAEVVLYNRKNKEIARTTIDVEDVDKIKGYRWHLTGNGYAVTNIGGDLLFMQHAIADVKRSRKRQLDHRDRNKLNNRKQNLRFCTTAENCSNVGMRRNNTSGFKGVAKYYKRWQVCINVKGRKKHIGTFVNKIEAAIAYNKAAIKHHGEFACLNVLPLEGRG